MIKTVVHVLTEMEGFLRNCFCGMTELGQRYARVHYSRKLCYQLTPGLLRTIVFDRFVIVSEATGKASNFLYPIKPLYLA